MIVKNESKVIKRCLDSVKPLIDYWVIVDTGSNDRTQDIIKEHMKDIPGELYERPWKNFGENRNEALELAKGKGDYYLFMDADDWLEYDADFKLPPLNDDLYYMWRLHGVGVSYKRAELVKATRNWRWVGVVHEYIDCEHPQVHSTLDGVKYISGSDGSSHYDPEKFLKYVNMLEEGLKKEPNNARYAFYLAESYSCAGNKAKALECYLKRINMGGWDEEVFWSKLQVAELARNLDLPANIVADLYLLAHRFRPHRAEPIYFLAELYNNQGKHSLAYELLKAQSLIPKPNQKDILFNLDWVEQYGLLCQLSISAYHMGHYQESLDICNTLLQIDNLPENWRKQTESNRAFALAKLNPSPQTLCSNYGEQILSDDKTVFLAILARNKGHLLPTYLKCIEELDYNKKNIVVYINTNNNTDDTKKILEVWTINNQAKYKEIIFEHHNIENLTINPPHEWTSDRLEALGKIRNFTLQKALEHHCDFYFVADCDAFIAPYTLKILVSKDKPIIAPNLRGIPAPGEIQATFWADTDENGYFKDHSDYWKILNREVLGTFKVPLVHQVYLIKSDYLDKLTYTNGTGEWEFIVFSRSARNKKVAQYICNEKDFGYFLCMPGKMSLEEESSIFQKELKNLILTEFGFDSNFSISADTRATQLNSPPLSNPLKGRMDIHDKRYMTFKLVLQLLEERDAKTLVETGTARLGEKDFYWNGGSTIIFSNWANLNNAFLYSVDISKESIKNAANGVKQYRESVQLVEDDSVHFLQIFPKEIDFLYLDSFDFDFNDPEPSQNHHLKEIEAAYDKLTPDCVIMIDDCKLPYGGKGKLVIEFLLQRGWQILADEYQVILVRKSSISLP